MEKEPTAQTMPPPITERRPTFKSYEAKSLRSRSLLTQISDDLTNIFGSTTFLILNLIFFAQWIVLNLGLISGFTPWDPFPFGLLTMIVSLEAIFLAIFVLVAQNRASAVSSIREEVHLQVNIIAEEEITKILEVLAEIRKEMGIKKADPELEEMLTRVDTTNIEQRIIEQMARANKPIGKQLIKDVPSMLTYPIRKPYEMFKNATNSDSKN